MDRRKSNRVNVIKFPVLKMKWDAKIASLSAFKGIKDYEEWAMGLAQEVIVPQQGYMEGMAPIEEGWMTPEMFAGPQTEKDKLYSQALEVRRQLDEAIASENYEKAEILQQTLDIIELKWNKL